MGKRYSTDKDVENMANAAWEKHTGTPPAAPTPPAEDSQLDDILSTLDEELEVSTQIDYLHGEFKAKLQALIESRERAARISELDGLPLFNNAGQLHKYCMERKAALSKEAQNDN